MVARQEGASGVLLVLDERLKAALFNVLTAFPTIRGSGNTTQEKAVVLIVATRIAFNDDVIARLYRIFRHAPLLETPNRRPLDFPFDWLAGLRALGR